MKYMPGADIFEVEADCVINPVNCQAHKLQEGWQKGLAGAFEKRFPEVQEPFKNACRSGAFKPGGVQLVRVDRKTGRRSKDGNLTVANVATKDHWRDASRIEWVDEALRKLAGAVEARGIRSIAIPQLGAGLGRLPWSDVRKSIETHFGPLSIKGIAVTVLGESAEQEKAMNARPHPPRLDIAEPEGSRYVAGIGARNTPEPMRRKMFEVSKILASTDCILRSGGAEGADEYCEKGWDEVGGKKQIFLSWKGMNGRQPNGDDVFCFEYRDGDPEVEIAKAFYKRTKANPDGDRSAWNRLGRGGKAHMSRNTNQVLGPNVGKSPVTSVILCWTERGLVVGGTGQALRLAEDRGIPVVNLGDPALKGIDAKGLAQIALSRIDGMTMEEAMKGVEASRCLLRKSER